MCKNPERVFHNALPLDSRWLTTLVMLFVMKHFMNHFFKRMRHPKQFRTALVCRHLVIVQYQVFFRSLFLNTWGSRANPLLHSSTQMNSLSSLAKAMRMGWNGIPCIYITRGHHAENSVWRSACHPRRYFSSHRAFLDRIL